MLSNATYNLMETAAVISKGLHRYPQFEEDAVDCQACKQMWNEMRGADDKQLGKIVSHLKEHLDEDIIGDSPLLTQAPSPSLSSIGRRGRQGEANGSPGKAQEG